MDLPSQISPRRGDPALSEQIPCISAFPVRRVWILVEIRPSPYPGGRFSKSRGSRLPEGRLFLWISKKNYQTARWSGVKIFPLFGPGFLHAGRLGAARKWRIRNNRYRMRMGPSGIPLPPRTVRTSLYSVSRSSFHLRAPGRMMFVASTL